jgi:hypothetical protein
MEAIQSTNMNILAGHPIDFKFGISNLSPTINKTINGNPIAKNTMVSRAQNGIWARDTAW